MIQKLLADRFKLTFHRENRELSGYALLVGKNGAKLRRSEADAGNIPNLDLRGLGHVIARNATLAEFAGFMQGVVLDRPLVDRTGLTERVSFDLNWTPDETQFGGQGGNELRSEDSNALPTLFTAIQEQLGLRLEAAKLLVEVLVVDHAEKPSEN